MKKNRILNNKQKYVVGYCRFSSDNQGIESIEGQQKEILRYVENNDLILLRWYVDEAKTGTTANRKSFQLMIEDSKNKEFGQVLVYQLDRFARDEEDKVIHFVSLRKNGVKVVSVTEHFDDTPEGKLMEAVVSGIAAYYSRDLARKTLRGMKLNAEKGFNNGGTTPYGYKLVPRLDENNKPMFHKKGHALHNIAINPEQAEAVKIMFDMTIKGYTRHEIIEQLTKQGFRKENGEKITGTFIDHILRNERYTGEYWYYYNKNNINFNPESDNYRLRITKGFDPIISKEDFNVVQKILETRRHRAPTNAQEDYLLTGKIICGECGSNYNGMRCKRNGKPYVYYQCTDQHSYKNGQKREKYCHNNSIRRDEIEKLVIDKIKEIVFTDNLVEQVLDNYNKFAIDESKNNSMIKMLENKIRDYDNQMKNIANAIGQNTENYSIQTLLDRLHELEQNKKQATELLEKETIGNNTLTATVKEILNIYQKAQKILDGNDISAKRAIINNFLNKIIVKKDTVEIYLNLLPLTCCASLDIDILKNNLFMGDLSVGDWDFAEYPDYPITTLKQYREYKEKPSTRFIPSFTGLNLIGSPGRIRTYGLSVNSRALHH